MRYKKGAILEICDYCLKKIHSLPIRLRVNNKTYKYNFAHKLCKDRYEKKNNTITQTTS